MGLGTYTRSNPVLCAAAALLLLHLSLAPRTLGLEYALSYPDVCLGLILRGIFLNTAAEFEAIYKRASFVGNARRLGEFDTFFELAAKEVQGRGEPSPSHPALSQPTPTPLQPTPTPSHPIPTPS